MPATLVFDIETIPDTAALRGLHGLDSNVADVAVVEMAQQMRRQASGSDFLPHYLQRVIAISCVLREGDQFRVWSLGKPDDPEAELLRRFFDGIERYTPQLVSWNGGGFDLPVLHYRALKHAVPAARYWETGDEDRDFRYNNYISRYHQRHIDLMDLLALYQPRAYAPLDQMARLCGLPGKLGMDGSEVWPAWQRGEIGAIRDYCETDVVNTYLLFLRFQLMRGVISPGELAAEEALVKSRLAETPGAHWKAYLAHWGGAEAGLTAP
jgi:predicted PolB exonuclease-like 3'-5' exonuclease